MAEKRIRKATLILEDEDGLRTQAVMTGPMIWEGTLGPEGEPPLGLTPTRIPMRVDWMLSAKITRIAQVDITVT